MDEAERYFRKALEAHPGHTMALARLGTMLRGKLPDEDWQLLERRLADPNLNESMRGPVLFALAHVLDAKGEYARAAECLAPLQRVGIRGEQDPRQTLRAQRARAVRLQHDQRVPARVLRAGSPAAGLPPVVRCSSSGCRAPAPP